MTSQEDGLTPLVVGRYAPSPTGRLHLGNARTALLSWWSARALGGRYLMRIEDLDEGRCRPEFESAIYEDLRWLGLDWDEGPDVGGANGPYKQSECGEIYSAAMARLETYPCVCTRREIREAVSAPHGATPVYPGLCAAGAGEASHKRASWRVRVSPQVITVQDRLAGSLSQELATDVGDFIVRRADGAFAYQLAVVVDDDRMGVSEVYRGTDLLESTPRQIFLQQALGLRAQSYAHAPLVLGEDGAKLNKGHGAPDLSALREAGVDPRTVVSALAHSVGLIEPGLLLSAQECVGAYDEGTVALQVGDRGVVLHPSWPSRH